METNRVELTGRLALLPERLGDAGETMVWRIRVERPEGGSDSLACRATQPAVIRVLDRAGIGDELEIEGSLRSRYWRAGPGIRSQTEVEVTRARRLRRGGQS